MHRTCAEPPNSAAPAGDRPAGAAQEARRFFSLTDLAQQTHHGLLRVSELGSARCGMRPPPAVDQSAGSRRKAAAEQRPYDGARPGGFPCGVLARRSASSSACSASTLERIARATLSSWATSGLVNE